MKAIIDTSSLISLVRYYLPFDKDGKLKVFLEDMISEGKIIILDKVAEECKYQGKGLVTKIFPFLESKNNITDSTIYSPNRRLFNMIDHTFINGSVCGQLDDAEYQSERDKFVNSADFAMILYAASFKEAVVIVTEETGYSNDGKPFKKIPEICKSLEIRTQSLPAFLFENDVITISVDVAKATLF